MVFLIWLLNPVSAPYSHADTKRCCWRSETWNPWFSWRSLKVDAVFMSDTRFFWSLRINDSEGQTGQSIKEAMTDWGQAEVMWYKSAGGQQTVCRSVWVKPDRIVLELEWKHWNNVSKQLGIHLKGPETRLSERLPVFTGIMGDIGLSQWGLEVPMETRQHPIQVT